MLDDQLLLGIDGDLHVVADRNTVGSWRTALQTAGLDIGALLTQTAGTRIELVERKVVIGVEIFPGLRPAEHDASAGGT